MSYDAQEISVQSGAPVELFEFVQGPSTWRYTSAATDYEDVSESPQWTYTAAPITRSSIAATEEAARNRLDLTVPRDFPVAELYRVTVPSEVVTITVRRVHRGDASDPVVAWVGRVLSCSFDGAQAKLSCEPITVSLRRTGLRRLYGLGCPWVLYGTGCSLDRTDFDHATVVDAISGLTLTVDSVETGRNYAGGFAEWVNDDGVTERRFIESAADVVLTLSQAFAGIAVTDVVTIYPGCDHTLTTCDQAFGNSANYGGFPWIPQKNPFNGNPVA